MSYSLIIFIIIIFFFLIYKNRENFTIGSDRSIQCLAPMPLPNQDKDMYKKKDTQLPWCKGWGGGKHKYKCFINKHLQRKCYWSCQ